MANRMWDRSWVLGKNRVYLQGSFFPQGTGAPINPRGRGWTVARTGVGLFTVTFQDPYCDLDAVLVGVTSATLGVSAQSTSIPVVQQSATVASFTLATVVAGAAADLAANVNTMVNFLIVFKNTSGNF